MTAIDLLASLNVLIDPEHIEAKRASELGKSILETICAFANEPGLGGGWLWVASGATGKASGNPQWHVSCCLANR